MNLADSGQTDVCANERQRDWFTRLPIIVRPQEVNFCGERKNIKVLDFLDAHEQHYTGSFGTQWTKYRHVQIDRFNGTRASFQHLETFTLGDLDVLRGKTILEIGSGAGRFTDYLVDLADTVITVDPSAIQINVALGAPNLVPVRADLFDVPVKREKIDVVFCRGVTQHTADTRRAITRLFDYVKPGGIVLFDVYHLKWFTPFCLKYWLRPFTRRISAERFIPFAEQWVPRLLKFKHSYVNPLLPHNKLGINIANQLVPIADYTSVAELGSWERQVEWSILDTVDMYTPRYDRPMTWGGVMRALREVGAQDIRGDYSSFCFKATAPR
jgi:2-polyprenyl-3-methyl-5-hydroxy-6-metoxy-1,4-benzoquinol methylase